MATAETKAQIEQAIAAFQHEVPAQVDERHSPGERLLQGGSIAHLGDGTTYNGIRDKSRDHFTPGKFVAPHSAYFDQRVG